MKFPKQRTDDDITSNKGTETN